MARGPLSLVAAGDVIPMTPLFPGGEPVTPAFGRVVEAVSGGDLAVGNLDAVLSERGWPREKLITVRAPLAVAPDLRRMGFDVISVANNHGMDYGEVGMFDTLEALESAGVAPVGGGEDLGRASAPAIVERNGWRVGVLAWSCVLPTGSAASPERPGLAPLHVHASYEVNPYLLMEEPTTAPTVRTRVDEGDLALACESIARLRAEVDFVVALPHWGGGLSEDMAEYQRPLGRALIDAGADVVVGSHPHRVMGIELHDGKAIFYSPGTLVEQLSREGLDPELLPILALLSPDSFVATLDIAPGGEYGIRIAPMTIVADGVPAPAEGEAFERVAERLVRISAELGTEIRVQDGALVVATTAAVPA